MPDYVPVIREIAPPRSATAAFEKLAGRPGAILLESGTREPKLARWSFLACDPFLTLRSKGGRVEIRESKSRGVGDSTGPATTRYVEGDPFAVLRGLLSEFPVSRPSAAPPLIAGAIGYFAYDLGRFVERIPERTVDDVPIADCHLGFYGAVAALDHVAGRAWVSAIGAPEMDPSAAKRLAQRRAEELESLLHNLPSPIPTPRLRGFSTLRLSVSSNFTHRDYLRAVQRAKDYIAAGDIYQVNLSQRLSAPLASDPWSLYRRLTEENPAPFSAYFETPEAAIISCSPERFLQVRAGEVETRPIKGTRPRAATPEEDARLAAELLASEKDRAENVMIVDLERNDLGRVCGYGSVHVPELFALESYATVHHLVSTVRGRLRPGKTALDCLRASFPGGSITGAPKVRSMEIIEELEPTRRGVYTGAIGYLCFSGDMDVNIVIRTVVVKDGTAYFQVGGAIVADSDPEGEYQETLDKARALARGLAAEAGTEDIRWPQ
ncbi:MAG: aminodeoxychorismate synthase, component I [Armatimonadota bacterium]